MKNLTLFSVLILLLFSCSKKNGPKSGDKVITKFVFTKANNPSLTEDVEGVISGNEIKVVLHGVAKTNLKPTITHTSKSINSNEEAKDFTNPVTYTLTAEDGSTVNYSIKVETRDVYMAGYTNASICHAAYWKNGNKVLLPDNSLDSKTTGIVINGNDVYVAGNIYSNGLFKAVYWKNGTLIELAPNAISSYVSDIILNNEDVYILYSVTNTDNKTEYAYWKNGIKTVIDANMLDMRLNRIYISGNDMYFGGYIIENNQYKAAYWKNGNLVLLNNESNLYLSSLSVVNNDVYAFGNDNKQPGGFYWKNGIKNTYSFDNEDYVYNGKIIGTDIYMVGEYYDANKDNRIAAYWKNGIKTKLSNETGNSKATIIIAIENDIYISGIEKKSNSNFYLPTYWINGKKITINSEDNYNINSIFVKSN